MAQEVFKRKVNTKSVWYIYIHKQVYWGVHRKYDIRFFLHEYFLKMKINIELQLQVYKKKKREKEQIHIYLHSSLKSQLI